MRYDKEYLLSLIPAIYRLRDYVRDDSPHGPLEALVDAIAQQTRGLELNIEQLYDDLFIETCADWVVPYIGDYIGYKPLSGATAAVSSPRAEVANTIGYRRRKGTLTVLENLVEDVTGWPAVARECYTGLSQTQYLNHLRPNRTSTASLRESLPSLADRQLFLDLPHAVDVRRISSGRGTWNIPNIAISLYRLGAYHITGGDAAAVDPANPERFTFHPLGLDAPLFQPQRALTSDQERATLPQNVPSPASPRLLYAELEQRRALINSGATPDIVEEHAIGFTAAYPIAAVYIAGVAIDPQFIQVCDLSEWTGSSLLGIQASIDPKLGRIVLANDPAGASVSVDYWYGFSGEYGAGAYSRDDAASPHDVQPGDDLGAAITAALTAPNADVRVLNSETLTGNLSVTLNPGQKLVLRAGPRDRPVVDGSLTVDLGAGSGLTLIGFVVSQGIVVTGGLGVVELNQCTMRPGVAGAVSWQGTKGGTLTVTRSLTGPLRLDDLLDATVSESVIDGGDDANAAIESTAGGTPAGSLSMDSVTVIGTVQVREIKSVQDCLLTGTMTSTRTQQGCVRFTYLPRNSVTPHRYECQPETAVRRAVAAARDAGATVAQISAIDAATTARVRPEFTSVDIANPAYAQLGSRCAAEIRSGAEDGSEMGVYRALQLVMKENNLRTRVAEYLRISLEAGVFDAS